MKRRDSGAQSIVVDPGSQDLLIVSIHDPDGRSASVALSPTEACRLNYQLQRWANWGDRLVSPPAWTMVLGRSRVDAG